MRTELRHGWGGNIKERDRVLRMRREALAERRDPNTFPKFDDKFKPTPEDLSLLRVWTDKTSH